MTAMKTTQVRDEVQAFRRTEAPDWEMPDCFPAWFLKHSYGISGVQAKIQSSDPALVGKTKGDSGSMPTIWNLREMMKFKLALLQAKYTDSTDQIRKGFKDLKRCLLSVENILKGIASPQLENRIYVNLRSKIQSEKMICWKEIPAARNFSSSRSTSLSSTRWSSAQTAERRSKT